MRNGTGAVRSNAIRLMDCVSLIILEKAIRIEYKKLYIIYQIKVDVACASEHIKDGNCGRLVGTIAFRLY